jgi:ARG and Rhodanese-Phosphatase-superfamily-associated Protein domain
MDLFDQSMTFEKLWPKLVRSYAIDSFEASEERSNLPRDAVVAWLNAVLSAKSETFRSPGIGDDVRFEGENLVGSSLLVEDEPIHTELFIMPAH